MEYTQEELNNLPWEIRLWFLYGSDKLPAHTDVDPKETYQKFCIKYYEFSAKRKEIEGNN